MISVLIFRGGGGGVLALKQTVGIHFEGVVRLRNFSFTLECSIKTLLKEKHETQEKLYVYMYTVDYYTPQFPTICLF